MNRHAALLVLAILLVGAAAVAPLTSASEVVAIDEEQGLTDQKSIERYEDRGVASAEVSTPQTSLTIADDREDVGRGNSWFSADTYLRVQYHEDINRSIRLYIPEDYWPAYEDQSLESLDGQTQAEMEPVEANGTTYSAVTIHFDGEADAVFAIDDIEASLWDLRGGGFDILDRSVPWTLPRLSGPDDNPWEYVDSRDFADGSYDTNVSDVIVEYDKHSNSLNETTWLEAPNCDADKPACTIQRGGDVVVIPKNSSDPPAVRYKTDPALRDRVKSGSRGVGEIVGNAWTDAKELVSGTEED